MLKEMKQPKRRNVQALLFFLMLSTVISCNRCKEKCDDATNPDCPNYVALTPIDPCVGAELTSADFQLFQNLPIPNALDSNIEFYQFCFLGSDITLHAIQDSADYHWIIGSDNYYTRDVTLSFGSQWENQNILLKLVVTRIPDIACYPNDNGVDTISKVLIPRNECNASFWGHYYGAWEDQPNDSFEISFTHDEITSCYPLMISGAKPGLDAPCAAIQSYYTDNFLVVEQVATLCYNPSGVAILDSTLNILRFQYSISLTDTWNEPREYHIFNGYRIN